MNQSLDDVDSGCIGVCSTLFDPVCQGCGRTQLEVERWIFLTRIEKQQIVDRIKQERGLVKFK